MNKVLLLLVVAVFMAVGVLIANLGDDNENTVVAQAESVSAKSPKPADTKLSEAEKDTYVNTIQTISAQYRNLEKEFKTLLERQKTDKEEMPTDTEISQTVGKRVTESADDIRRDFHEKLKKLRAGLEKKIKQRRSKNGKGIPQGLGFDDLPGMKKGNGIGFPGAPTMLSGWSTVMPIGTEPSVGKDGKLGSSVLNWYAKKTDKPQGSVRPVAVRSSKKSASRKKDPKDLLVPAYTIPRNATLFDNDTMTALLGVIPVEGSILDPIRFKVITGKTNMATNGMFIPGVRNIVWSGIAIGNREMSCVRGELHSVTFTFEDGTVSTVSTSKISTIKKGSGNKRILGYISDRQGSPCLRGQLITNASDYLKDRMVASGVAATAEVYSSTQQTNVVTASGAVQSFFSGDKGDYIAGKALAGSLTELSQYMRERARNAVDLVFLEAGQQVVLHVESPIEIDYDPNGRKLEYANPLSVSANSYRLD